MSPVFQFLLFAGLIFIVFRLVKFLLTVIDIKIEKRKWINRYLPLSEFVAWVVLIIHGISKFYIRFPLYSYALFVLLIVLTLIVSWFMFKDLIAGIIFKSNRNFTVNETISFNDLTGKIIRFESRTLVLETFSGKNIHVPYSGLLGSVVSKSNPAEKIMSKKILLDVPKDHSFSKLFVLIREDIMNLPWASVKKYPQINLIEERSDSYHLEVIIFSIEEEYLYKMEQYLKGKYKH